MKITPGVISQAAANVRIPDQQRHSLLVEISILMTENRNASLKRTSQLHFKFMERKTLGIRTHFQVIQPQ